MSEIKWETRSYFKNYCLVYIAFLLGLVLMLFACYQSQRYKCNIEYFMNTGYYHYLDSDEMMHIDVNNTYTWGYRIFYFARLALLMSPAATLLYALKKRDMLMLCSSGNRNNILIARTIVSTIGIFVAVVISALLDYINVEFHVYKELGGPAIVDLVFLLYIMLVNLMFSFYIILTKCFEIKSLGSIMLIILMALWVTGLVIVSTLTDWLLLDYLLLIISVIIFYVGYVICYKKHYQG